VEVSGPILSFNRGVAFLSFSLDGQEEIAMFRPNRLYIDGEKVPSNKVKTLEGLSTVLNVADRVFAIVDKNEDVKTYTIKLGDSDEDVTISPRWFGTCVWKGSPPPSVIQPKEEAVNKPAPASQEVIIDNVPGKIILNQLGTGSARGAANQTLISFKNPDGQQDLAMFRNPRNFFINGQRILMKEYKAWPKDYEIDVKFIAIHTPGLKEFSIAESGHQDGKMSTEMKYKPNWRAKLIWVGTKPTEEMIGEVASDKLKKPKEDPVDMTKDCTYLAGRIEKILDENQGIITCRSGRILFHIENFSVDGEHFTTQDNLLNLLEPGEHIFCYAKPLSLPNKITDVDITYEAASVWKGSRLSKNRPSNDANEEKENTKVPIPVPSEATHKNIVGVIESIENFALAVIKSEDPSLRGQKVLVTKRRMYVNGSKIKKVRPLSECFNLGDEIMLDLVRANPHRSLSSYNWLAVLAWVGETPDRSKIDDEISKKTESYRAKIVLFSDVKNQSCTDGIAQIIGGPGWLGESVLFNRNKTYIFGSSMKKGDFSLILKVNDKIQCEIEELSHPVTKNNVEIKLVASLVWVGPPPKLDECTDDIPEFVNGIVDPFIAKRGLTRASYLQLIRGELLPQSGKAPVVASAKNAPSPPKITQGRVVELKRPEHGSTTGTEHGIVKIDKGPHAQEKAFFNRSCFSCWGYNCFQADLMYLLNETDILMLEVQDGTNNKAVPFKVTAAWIGPHPHEKNKESMAMAGNPVFVKWLKDHSLTIDEFNKVVKGELGPKLFFPLSNVDTLHQARLVTLLNSGKEEGADAGILRLATGPMTPEDGRKAPEVLFERESFYLWNVHISRGDLNYVMSENDKYFVEVTDLIGKEKKKWKTRLGSANIPKFIATIVYVGGGRPKAEKLGEEISSNSNLMQWAKKRSMDHTLLERLIKGQLPPMQKQDVFSNAYKQVEPTKERSPFGNPSVQLQNSVQSDIMNKAVHLTQRTMLLRTPEDPEVQTLIQDDSDVQLAMFLSKTLTNAIMMYRQGGPGNDRNPGPIGPPRQRSAREMYEFYGDSGVPRHGNGMGRSEGLYGIQKSLFDHQGMGSLAPPYKRKFEY